MIDKSNLKRKNVVGFGRSRKITAGKKTDIECITFFVEKKLPASALAAEDLIPATIFDLPTDVIETGKIKALISRLDPVRPAPPGVSIGHYAITAGTFGAVVTDNKGVGKLILSNNHVLANSNAGAIGDPILQPGPYDGGKNPDDQIGYLYRYVPIIFEGDESPPDDSPTCSVAKLVAGLVNIAAILLGSSHRVKAIKKVTKAATPNTVDAAVALPASEADITDEILEIGKPIGAGIDLPLGTPLQKSGRTSGLTKGEIDALDVTVSVEYGDGLIAVFEEQIVSGIKSQGGDSGSLVLTDARMAAGLLFAGSDTITIINPIEQVLSLLDVTI